jgi:ribosomal protein S18 acetylase RimI-like enzyme
MTVRRLTSGDITLVIPLLAELGYPTTTDALAKRVAAVSANPDDALLVAEEHGSVVGLVAVHSFEMLHRPGRLGRITALIVSSGAQGRGVGSELLGAAEAHLRQLGCIQLEVTSAERREGAHAFYIARGYNEKRVRFVKSPAT